MCTVIVTIRAVLWYVTSLVATLLILVALFTDRWLHGRVSTSNVGAAVEGIENMFNRGELNLNLQSDTGLFLECTRPKPPNLFEGECIPNVNDYKDLFADLDDDNYPHAWRGAVICFVVGFGLLVITNWFALLTLCCRSCICCSVFTVCGSFQSFAALLFTIGLIAFPAGWGSRVIKENLCNGQSNPFVLGGPCTIGFAFWLAVAGALCTWVASSLALWAYQSTKSSRCLARQDEGDRCICLP